MELVATLDFDACALSRRLETNLLVSSFVATAAVARHHSPLFMIPLDFWDTYHLLTYHMIQRTKYVVGSLSFILLLIHRCLDSPHDALSLDPCQKR